MAIAAPPPDRVPVTHPDKLLFPDAGITKADLAAYYAGVADAMLPHVRGRPVSMQVFHEGVERPGHFMKQAPDYFPKWVKRVVVPKKGGTVTHVVADSAATLVLLANHNVITPHVWTSRVDRLDRPDRLIVDLDPSGDDEFERVRAGAQVMRDIYAAAGLAPFVMTTGSRGLHVVAPIRREVDFDGALELASELARVAVEAMPDDLTTAFRKEGREGRVFVDVLRNRWAQTAVPPYAVRPRPEAPVATPLRPEELDSGDLHPRRWTVLNVRDRLAAGGDPWADIGAAAVSPRSALRRARKL
jgi:bifunctional non-homologous end joining protein LigD